MTNNAAMKQDQDANSEVDGRFVTEADWIPSFWNYLLDLNAEDLIAELIQNDLDQDATRTVVSFEEDRLICEGNGRPVDEEGWQRLRKIQGAGYAVTAKRGKIGVKNHGLKAAFTVGDELRVESSGRAIVQTLYAHDRNQPPHPGASPKPVTAPDAPTDGCRVAISYRHAEVTPEHGEATVLRAINTEELDRLFQHACDCAPEQFAGVVSPEVVPNYEVVLRHWRLGEARFVFGCTRPRRIGKGIELFRRRCSVSGNASPLPASVLEEVTRRRVPLRGRLKERVSDFYRRRRSFLVEVSWPIDRRGRPKTGTGRYRYPIGYPADSQGARTGHSAHYSAPFASDNRRQAPSRQEATNAELRKACAELLVDALTRRLVPKWGPDGLNPLVPGSGKDQSDEAIRPLLAALAARGAMPILSWRAAGGLLFRRENKKVVALARRLSVRRIGKEARRYKFIVPAATWEGKSIHRGLALLSPRAELQLDARVHRTIVGLLTDGKTPGYDEHFVALTEEEVVSRVTGKAEEHVSGIVDRRRDFSEPLMARSCLALIKEMLDYYACNHATESALIGALLLPDSHCRATPLSDLYSRSALPSDIPGLRLPPLLHPALAGHALLKRVRWRRPQYKMATFLESGALETADERTRRQFWAWLRQNGRRIGRRDRPKLANLVIWPDRNGDLCTVSELCCPRSRRVLTVLGEHIRVPHEEVRRSGLAPIGRKAGTSIRPVPTVGEVQAWLDARTSEFIVGETVDIAQAKRLKSLEADVASLSKDRSIARSLKQANVTLPALAQDGRVQCRASLVMPSRLNDRLCLPARLLLKDGRRAKVLNRLTPALRDPDAGMLLETFVEDGNNTPALQARLKRFLDLNPDEDERRMLAGMPIIPVQGKLRAPSELAFHGNRDYWGDWKTAISKRGMSQDGQRRYLQVGVTSASPKPATSRAFFVWLSAKDEGVLRRHVACVIRHILHKSGPTSWAEGFTETPFIPARGQDGLRIVSLKAGRHSPVYLFDAGDIGEEIIQRDRRVLLAVDHVREVTQSISEVLGKLGVRSLRAALKEPERVAGVGQVAGAPSEIRRALDVLRSESFRRTFWKRLSDLQVESRLARRDWHERLNRINVVRFADGVEATYRFWRKPYLWTVDAGFDPVSGVFWMKRDAGVGPSKLYRTLAEQLVFRGAKQIELHALELAVGLQIKDPSFGGTAVESEANGDGVTFGEDDLGNEGDPAEEPDTDSGEAPWGHTPFTPDPTRNLPEEGPLTESAGSAPVPEDTREPAEPEDGGNDTSTVPPIERIHREELMRRYASHCQMCLCDRLPQDLAPAGSYIESEEVRRSVMHAHHVDAKAGGGARHGGNLLLLCKLHHHNFGARLTRDAITVALREERKRVVKRFAEDSVAEGPLLELEIADTGEVVRLFLTEDHAKYWLRADVAD